MTYQETMSEINDRRKQMSGLRAEMRELQSAIEPEEVEDYTFTTPDGPVNLRSLFKDKDTLFLIHNRGKSCVNCTQWADGFNGVLDHLLDRAAFAVSSPDSPQVQREFAEGRGWKFTMVSHEGMDWLDFHGHTNSNIMNQTKGVPIYEIYQKKSTIFS
jgi:predicted dithiol-disulfide oxidoreductase (DUF899 family)